MENDSTYPSLNIAHHPLIEHKLTLLRDKTTSKKEFRELVREVSTLIAYEMTRDLELSEITIETPMELAKCRKLKGKKLCLVPVLRAGLGMVDGVLDLLPSARVGHVGMYREHDSLKPVDYYFKIPGNSDARDFIIIDPMLATGGTAIKACSMLKKQGIKRLRFMCLIAASDGVTAFASKHPDVPIYAAAIDKKLDKNGYITPGLGDAGDRIFGTR